MAVTINDVAKEAGVSITTVSRVINGNYPVKQETRQRVEEAIKKLNFQPNPIARSLVSRKTNSIGIVVPSITNMYFTEVVDGIEKYARNNSYDIFLNITNGDAKVEINAVNKFIERYVDGIIVVDPQTENILSGFYNEIVNTVPVVFVNGYHQEIDLSFVISNEENGFKNALKHLNKTGHKNIIFVRGESSYSYDLKENIYRKFIKNIGSIEYVLTVNAGNSIEVVENTKKSIINVSRDIKLGEDFTALIACNDLMATGALNACLELGIKVPDEFSIIGFDNIILSQMTTPKLSTVDQNMKKLGEKSAEMLFNYIESGYEADKVLINTKLILRESCRI
ncbi:MAG: ccpA1 [Caloramator sp.]|jgi:LacI family transcriptional regulator|uniref:LacI family DNA-binding transcriptional regulator n=1 Tax=Caloramator sp. TaxID=1871330 RepID=UPI001D210D9A|nr:LacI family DNA-binding transcriptional regulator [Caloramator sp.]MBZ4663361.1 ccpA1 [Caloramator sp.]